MSMFMRRAFVRLFCLTALFVLATTIFTSGQGITTGSISGTLQDSQKAVVTVEQTPPLVESQTSQITNTFEAIKTQDLPIGNGFDSLALLVPGVASTEGAGFGNSNGARFSINGQRSRSNNFEIDGQQNN